MMNSRNKMVDGSTQTKETFSVAKPGVCMHNKCMCERVHVCIYVCNFAINSTVFEVQLCFIVCIFSKSFEEAFF